MHSTRSIKTKRSTYTAFVLFVLAIQWTFYDFMTEVVGVARGI